MCLCTNKMSNQQATLATHEACNEPFSFMRSKIKLKWYCFISSLAHMNTKETTRGGGVGGWGSKGGDFISIDLLLSAAISMCRIGEPPCMGRHTRAWGTDELRHGRRTRAREDSISVSTLLWFLPNLLVSSLLRSLRLFHVVEAVRGKILHLLLLLLSFVVDALLVSTLLIWARRVWGGACNGSETPCNKTRNWIVIVHC